MSCDVGEVTESLGNELCFYLDHKGQPRMAVRCPFWNIYIYIKKVSLILELYPYVNYRCSML